jgi:ribosomal-protein-alanine N-acetyltransferase
VTVPAGGGRLQVVVAPLRSRDLKAVLRIEDEVFDEPWSKRLFEEELAQRASRAYRGAWVGDVLVGYAGQMSVDDEAHVNNIAVAPTWVGRRLGTVLMADLVRTALARGSAHLTLEVAVGNDTAQTLYRRFGMAPGVGSGHARPRGHPVQRPGRQRHVLRFGMAPVGVRPNYYARGGDALIMWVRDIDTGAYAERLAGIEASLAPVVDVERRA